MTTTPTNTTTPRRPLFPWETRARVRFAAMEDRLTSAYAALEGQVEVVRAVVVDVVLSAVEGVRRPDELQRVLFELGAQRPGQVTAAVDSAAAASAGVLGGAMLDAGESSVAEAVDQGIAGAVGRRVVDQVETAVREARPRLLTLGEAAPARVWQRLISAATDGAGPRPPLSVDEVRDLLLPVPMDGPVDLAKQGVHIVAGQGRYEAQTRLPEPAEVYASELLDSNTCSECARLDGKEYPSLAAAYVDYPGAGPMARCRGGDRCRGTVVVVYDETPPSVSGLPGR